VHCSGGGQTKCLKYLFDTYKIVKNNLFPSPKVFQLIKQASNADDRGDVPGIQYGASDGDFTTEKSAPELIKLSLSYGIDAKIVGFVEKSSKRVLNYTPENLSSNLSETHNW
jgi:phosphoribosylformylglycinamidine cyclo-ligase